MTERDRHELEAAAEDERSDHNMGRREFLARTAALAGLAGLAAALPAETLISQAAKVQTRARLPEPSQHADRHLRRADDGEPLVRPLLRRGSRTPTERTSRPHLPGRRRASSTRPIRSRPTSRAAASATPTTAGRAAARSTTTASSTASTSPTTSTRSATTTSLTCRSCLTLRRRSRCTTATSPRSSGRRTPTATTMWSAQSGGQITNSIPAGGNNFETIFDRAQAAGLSVRVLLHQTCRLRRCSASARFRGCAT